MTLELEPGPSEWTGIFFPVRHFISIVKVAEYHPGACQKQHLHLSISPGEHSGEARIASTLRNTCRHSTARRASQRNSSTNTLRDPLPSSLLWNIQRSVCFQEASGHSLEQCSPTVVCAPLVVCEVRKVDNCCSRRFLLLRFQHTVNTEQSGPDGCPPKSSAPCKSHTFTDRAAFILQVHTYHGQCQMRT